MQVNAGGDSYCILIQSPNHRLSLTYINNETGTKNSLNVLKFKTVGQENDTASRRLLKKFVARARQDRYSSLRH